jgi:hypothetical protein
MFWEEVPSKDRILEDGGFFPLDLKVRFVLEHQRQYLLLATMPFHRNRVSLEIVHPLRHLLLQIVCRYLRLLRVHSMLDLTLRLFLLSRGLIRILV